ncbi:MAG TPA: AAA family ATPase [Thermoplasmata archaeon]|nr:AAA family ATPase [Thermoplasmata archaeon]
MADAFPWPAAFQRALAGLAEGSGRTVVIAGPPLSGKSALVAEVRARLTSEGARVTDLKGAHRDRDAPYALVAPLESPVATEPSPEPSEEESPGPAMPIAAVGTYGDEGGRSRRARGERQRGRIMGMSYAVRSRGVAERDPSEYWGRLSEEFRSDGAVRQAILVDDATYSDNESRDYLLFLIERARLRPLLLVLVLDSGDPSYGAWEEKLLGRGDVDWVHRAQASEDAREAARFKRAFEDLPPASQRIVALTALLGGSTQEVALSRVSRLPFRQLADALAPAIEARLMKVDSGRVGLQHTAWLTVLPEVLDDRGLRELHREIAEGLEALHPEPTLQRRIELAEHYFKWEAGATALRYLLEAAELSERLSAYDTAVELLDQALQCIAALPMTERPVAEVELRLLRARGLLYTGRVRDAELDIHEGATLAIDRGVPLELLEDWLEPLVPVLIAVGPRPSLATEVSELADRCERSNYLAASVLLSSVRIGYDVERGRAAEAQRDSRALGHAARRLEPGPAQALALLAIAAARMDGTPVERALMEKFVDRSDALLTAARRVGLQQFGEAIRAGFLARSGDAEAALQVHLRAVSVAQRLRVQPIELFHQVGILRLLLDTKPDERVGRVLKRTRELVDQLHLMPPAAGLFQLWILEGRHLALLPDASGARDRFSAVADRPPATVSPALFREACLRLASLELKEGREDVAQRYFERAASIEADAEDGPSWEEWKELGGPVGAEGSNPPLEESPVPVNPRRRAEGPGRARKRS